MKKNVIKNLIFFWFFSCNYIKYFSEEQDYSQENNYVNDENQYDNYNNNLENNQQNQLHPLKPYKPQANKSPEIHQNNNKVIQWVKDHKKISGGTLIALIFLFRPNSREKGNAQQNRDQQHQENKDKNEDKKFIIYNDRISQKNVLVKIPKYITDKEDDDLKNEYETIIKSDMYVFSLDQDKIIKLIKKQFTEYKNDNIVLGSQAIYIVRRNKCLFYIGKDYIDSDIEIIIEDKNCVKKCKEVLNFIYQEVEKDNKAKIDAEAKKEQDQNNIKDALKLFDPLATKINTIIQNDLTKGKKLALKTLIEKKFTEYKLKIENSSFELLKNQNAVFDSHPFAFSNSLKEASEIDNIKKIIDEIVNIVPQIHNDQKDFEKKIQSLNKSLQKEKFSLIKEKEQDIQQKLLNQYNGEITFYSDSFVYNNRTTNIINLDFNYGQNKINGIDNINVNNFLEIQGVINIVDQIYVEVKRKKDDDQNKIKIQELEKKQNDEAVQKKQEAENKQRKVDEQKLIEELKKQLKTTFDAKVSTLDIHTLNEWFTLKNTKYFLEYHKNTSNYVIKHSALEIANIQNSSVGFKKESDISSRTNIQQIIELLNNNTIENMKLDIIKNKILNQGKQLQQYLLCLNDETIQQLLFKEIEKINSNINSTFNNNTLILSNKLNGNQLLSLNRNEAQEAQIDINEINMIHHICPILELIFNQLKQKYDFLEKKIKAISTNLNTGYANDFNQRHILYNCKNHNFNSSYNIQDKKLNIWHNSVLIGEISSKKKEVFRDYDGKNMDNLMLLLDEILGIPDKYQKHVNSIQLYMQVIKSETLQNIIKLNASGFKNISDEIKKMGYDDCAIIDTKLTVLKNNKQIFIFTLNKHDNIEIQYNIDLTMKELQDTRSLLMKINNIFIEVLDKETKICQDYMKELQMKINDCFKNFIPIFESNNQQILHQLNTKLENIIQINIKTNKQGTFFIHDNNNSQLLFTSSTSLGMIRCANTSEEAKKSRDQIAQIIKAMNEIIQEHQPKV